MSGWFSGLQRALDAHVGRLADLHVQVAAGELHQRAEELVDFRFVSVRCCFDVAR